MASPFKFQKIDGLAVPKASKPLLHLAPSAVDAAQKIKPSQKLRIEDIPWVLKELKDNVGTGAKEIKEGVKDLVVNHPAELGLGLAAGLTLPATLTGILGAGALGVAGRAIDKTNPLTDKASDYKTESASDIAKDLALSGTLNGLTHGIFGKWPEFVDAEGALKSASGSSKYRYIIPEDEFSAELPEISKIKLAKLKDKTAIPYPDISGRTITPVAETGSGKLLYGSSVDDPMHGVAEYFDPRRIDPTIRLEPFRARLENPNRAELLKTIGTSDKKPIIALRYVADDGLGAGEPLTQINPRTLNRLGRQEENLFLAGTQNPKMAESYHTFRGPNDIMDAAEAAYNAGNHPEHATLEELYGNAIDDMKQIPKLNTFLEKTGVLPGPKFAHTVEGFPKNLAELDYAGRPYDNPFDMAKGTRGYDFEPEEYYQGFWDKGHDAIRIKNVKDPGNHMIEGANAPGELIIVAPGQHDIVQSMFGQYTGIPSDLYHVPKSIKKLTPITESKELIHLKGLLDGVSNVRHLDSGRQK